MLPGPPPSARKAPGNEVSGVNIHTRNVEFYGSSSSIALLFEVQRSEAAALRTVSSAASSEQDSCADGAAIVSSLHNPAFSPPATTAGHGQSPASEHCGGVEIGGRGGAVESPGGAGLAARAPLPELGMSARYRVFLDGFFSTIHHIHPIIDKPWFMERCEALWAGDQANEAASKGSFVALYYSVLSVGSLVGAREEEPMDGLSNLEWSRRFFDEARGLANKLGMVTDLEMVQCYFFLVGARVLSNSHFLFLKTGKSNNTVQAKVCQNEINPHCKCHRRPTPHRGSKLTPIIQCPIFTPASP